MVFHENCSPENGLPRKWFDWKLNFDLLKFNIGQDFNLIDIFQD